MDNSYSIEVVCLFCDAPLRIEDNKEYQSGDMINCFECKELNDYDSVLDIAKEKGIKLAKDEFEKEINSSLKNLFK
ncbi:hypothetical protein [Marinomonas colpomeniae]|uniref:Uncharacterized protein n=1 Tax=Marinomonas colpomeniae TaxID=2774408 RepID=A0ABR8NX29_9GAMM|nr:hypothetical protein [Marinomonas colpomeniae]MBD5770611.1 hypothetical protein [Marinomonas colpomeniae]